MGAEAQEQDAAQEGAFFILLLIYCITLTMDTPEPMFTSR